MRVILDVNCKYYFQTACFQYGSKCVWYTYNNADLLCIMYSECQDFSDAFCEDCISGQPACLLEGDLPGPTTNPTTTTTPTPTTPTPTTPTPTTPTPSPTTPTPTTTTMTPPIPECAFPDLAYIGEVLISGSLNLRDNAEDCQKSCQAIDQCLYWTWFSTDVDDMDMHNFCTLHYDREGVISVEGAVSGPKNCYNL